MDFSALGTLAGTIAAQNAPLIGNLFTTVATMAATAAGTAVAGPLGPLIGSAAGAGAKALSGLILSRLGAGLGTTADPDAIDAAIKADPAKAAPVLEQVETDHAELLKVTTEAANRELDLRLRDVQDARATTVKLAASGSGLAWGAPVVSTAVTLGFIGILAVMTLHVIPDSGVVNVLVGTLATAFGSVVNFWLGSSAGSQAKTQHLATLARAGAARA